MRVRKTAYTKVGLHFMALAGALGWSLSHYVLLYMSHTAQDISDCQINKYNMFYSACASDGFTACGGIKDGCRRYLKIK